MIKIENREIVGWKHAIRGMRNPMNSWDKSDSQEIDGYFYVGENDLSLMKKLAKAGTDHRKFMRMIVVYCDITAPLYWWKEFDTYKVGTVANSCSTMHKIHEKKFTEDDFSDDHLMDAVCLDSIRKNNYFSPTSTLSNIIMHLNDCRRLYLDMCETLKNDDMNDLERMKLLSKKKQIWWQMIQLLPSSYNQKRTVMMNYEVLANIYKSRKNHKLDEWIDLCYWIESLPHSYIITGKDIYFEFENESKEGTKNADL